MVMSHRPPFARSGPTPPVVVCTRRPPTVGPGGGIVRKRDPEIKADWLLLEKVFGEVKRHAVALEGIVEEAKAFEEPSDSHPRKDEGTVDSRSRDIHINRLCEEYLSLAQRVDEIADVLDPWLDSR